MVKRNRRRSGIIAENSTKLLILASASTARAALLQGAGLAFETQPSDVDENELKARDLLEWIQAHGGELHCHDFSRLPSEYRTAKAARPLLTFLVDAGHLQIASSNQHGKPASWRIREAQS